ncbi:MAG: F0F1 ATP synthase subunit delta [Oscillospiraceae bacterium]|nr:F0F1 ATP synthase subunit delta [Oscillospiraceae bacterium]
MEAPPERSVENMSHAILRSAAVLDAKQLADVETIFSTRLKQEIKFELMLDPSLVGGFVALIDGKLYDISLAAQLAELKKNLTKIKMEGN